MKLPPTGFLPKNGYDEIVDIGENPYNFPETKMVFVNRKDGRVLIPVSLKNIPGLQREPEDEKEEHLPSSILGAEAGGSLPFEPETKICHAEG